MSSTHFGDFDRRVSAVTISLPNGIALVSVPDGRALLSALRAGLDCGDAAISLSSGKLWSPWSCVGEMVVMVELSRNTALFRLL